MTKINVHFKLEEETFFKLKEFMAKHKIADYVSLVTNIINPGDCTCTQPEE